MVYSSAFSDEEEEPDSVDDQCYEEPTQTDGTGEAEAPVKECQEEKEVADDLMAAGDSSEATPEPSIEVEHIPNEAATGDGPARKDANKITTEYYFYQGTSYMFPIISRFYIQLCWNSPTSSICYISCNPTL